MKKEEYSLVYKAIHGDSHAYGELIHQYNPYFYKIAFLYVKNEDAAVEIVQDSVYQGYLKIKTLRNPELFSTWMTRIIMNKAVRYIKQNKKIVEYEEAFHEASHSEHVEEKLDLMNAVNRLRKNTKTSSFKNIFWKCLWRNCKKADDTGEYSENQFIQGKSSFKEDVKGGLF